jgi:hypothetical protein
MYAGGTILAAAGFSVADSLATEDLLLVANDDDSPAGVLEAVAVRVMVSV